MKSILWHASFFDSNKLAPYFITSYIFCDLLSTGVIAFYFWADNVTSTSCGASDRTQTTLMAYIFH